MNYSVQLVPLAIMYDGPPTLQLYARATGDTVGAAVGSPITGTVSADVTVWDFDVTSVAVGDYYGQIQGVSNPNSSPYPLRVTSTTVVSADSWDDIGVNILQTCATQGRSKHGTELFVSIDSKSLQTITCYNADGTTQTLTGRTLQFCVSEESDTADAGEIPVDQIEAADLTISGASSNVLQYRYTADMVATPRRLLWSLRDITSGYDDELQKGVLNVGVSAANV